MEPILLWVIAASMAVFTALLLRRGSTVSTLSDASVVLLLFSMMAVMFLSVVIYVYYPGLTVLWILAAFNMVSMSVFLVPLAVTIFFGNRDLGEYRPWRGIRARTAVAASVIVFVLTSEVFMAWAFEILSGSLRAAGGWTAVYSALVESSSSYWFVFTMAGEMALTFAAMRKRFAGGMGKIVGAQPLMMFLSPTAIESQAWADVSFLVSSAIMAGVFLYSLYYLRKTPHLTRGTTTYIACLILAYTVMMAGLLIWFAGGGALVFVASVLFQMTVYFYFILEDKQLGSRAAF